MQYAVLPVLFAATAVAQSTWIAQTPSIRPPARSTPGITYDRATRSVLIYGGSLYSTISAAADMWRWNGTVWTQVPIQASPQALGGRDGCGFCPDVAGGNLLFGGDDAALFDAGDTWEFDGTTWQQRFPAHSPPPRFLAGIAFAPPAGQTVLFGGFSTSAAGDLADTWVWDGTDWHSLPTVVAPSARSGAAMTYDMARQQVFLFGGRSATTDRDDCWYLDLQYAPATYASFGTGCAGPNALVPSLAALPGEVPALGTTSHLRVTNLPTTLTLPLFVLGLGNTVNAAPSYPLPFDLGPLGWPGCNQLVSFDVGSLQFTLTGQADLPFAVPLNLTLIGLSFHAQAFVLYQPTGAAVSNGITGLVGT